MKSHLPILVCFYHIYLLSTRPTPTLPLLHFSHMPRIFNPPNQQRKTQYDKEKTKMKIMTSLKIFNAMMVSSMLVVGNELTSCRQKTQKKQKTMDNTIKPKKKKETKGE